MASQNESGLGICSGLLVSTRSNILDVESVPLGGLYTTWEIVQILEGVKMVHVGVYAF